PWRISDVAPLSAFERLALYNEFYRHFQVNRQLIIGLRISPDTTVSMAFMRARRDFSETDKNVLQAFAPYCVTAWRTWADLSALTSRHDSLERALAASPQGFV